MTKIQLGARATDGATVDALLCRDEHRPIKGIVVVSHGFGEHSGSYDELTQRLAQAGYASVVFSQRGHGADVVDNGKLRVDNGSGAGDGEASRADAKAKDLRGVIADYDCFLDDIDAVSAAAKQYAPNVPIALYGHSMGGNIIANYLLRENRNSAVCAILESPWFGLENEVSPLVSFMAKVLGRLSPNIAIVNKLSPDDITGDVSKADWIRNDPLYHNRISLRMFAGINKGCANALANASKLTTPTFLAFAARERIVSNRAIAEFTSAAGKNVTPKEYDSCHAIHNDVRRDLLFQDIIEFLDAHCLTELGIRS